MVVSLRRFLVDLRLEELSEEAREKDFEFIRELPNLLAGIGFQILRLPARIL